LAEVLDYRRRLERRKAMGDAVVVSMRNSCDAELKRLQSVEKVYRAYVNRVIKDRKNDPRDAQIAALVEALEDVVKNDNWLMNQKFDGNSGWFDLSMQRAALAAVKGGDA